VTSPIHRRGRKTAAWKSCRRKPKEGGETDERGSHRNENFEKTAVRGERGAEHPLASRERQPGRRRLEGLGGLIQKPKKGGGGRKNKSHTCGNPQHKN